MYPVNSVSDLSGCSAAIAALAESHSLATLSLWERGVDPSETKTKSNIA